MSHFPIVEDQRFLYGSLRFKILYGYMRVIIDDSCMLVIVANRIFIHGNGPNVAHQMTYELGRVIVSQR